MNKLKKHIFSNLNIFKNVGIYSIVSITSGALNFLFISYYARMLDLKQMGIVGLVLAITYITTPAAIFGTTELVGINAINLTTRKFLIFFKNLNTFTLYILPFVVLIAFGASIYFQQGFIYGAIVVLFSITRSYVALSDKIFITKRKIRNYTIEKLRTGILTLFFGVILLKIYKSWESYFLAIIAAELISCYFRYRRSIHLINLKNNWPEFKSYFLYGLPFMIGLGGAWLLNQFDKVIVEKYFGPEVLGGYALAYQIGIIIRTFNTAITNAVYPNLYESFKKGNYLRVQLKYFFLFLAVSLGIFILLLLFVNYFFIDIYGEKYSNYRGIVILIGIAFIFEGLYKVWDSLLTYAKKNTLKTTILYMSALTGVTITMFLINILDEKAPALGVVVAYFSLLLFSFMFSFNLGKKWNI